MQALDSLAQVLPSSQVFPGALGFAQSSIKSASHLERRAACDVLTVIAEGCSKPARKSLEAILQVSLVVASLECLL